MIITLKNILINNTPLKVCSLIFGYCSWYLIGSAHMHTAWYTIPLSFYETPKQWIINAPETVTVLLSGKRAHLRNLNTEFLAAHINGKKLKKYTGTQPITLSAHELFLPDSIKLIHYMPTTIAVEMTKIQKQQQVPCN